MIADAVDTLVTLGWALLAWIVLTAATATLALYAVTVIAWTLLRPLRALWPRRAVCAPAGAPQGVSEVSRDAGAPSGAPQGPYSASAHPAPTWAQPDKDAEAA